MEILDTTKIVQRIVELGNELGVSADFRNQFLKHLTAYLHEPTLPHYLQAKYWILGAGSADFNGPIGEFSFRITSNESTYGLSAPTEHEHHLTGERRNGG